MKVFLVEDNINLSSLTKNYLVKMGMEVYECENFIAIEKEICEIKPDVIILDINLPYFDGYYICKEIRRKHSIPIIITSARNRDVDQIIGIEVGADDYLVKPYSMEVLFSKIKALVRRAYGEYSLEKEKLIKVEGIILDEENYKIINKNISIDLSKNEMKLLKLFFREPNKVIERSIFFEALWDEETFVDENTLNVNISRIKIIFKSLGISDVIKTKRGVGYTFDILKIGEECEI